MVNTASAVEIKLSYSSPSNKKKNNNKTETSEKPLLAGRRANHNPHKLILSRREQVFWGIPPLGLQAGIPALRALQGAHSLVPVRGKVDQGLGVVALCANLSVRVRRRRQVGDGAGSFAGVGLDAVLDDERWHGTGSN